MAKKLQIVGFQADAETRKLLDEMVKQDGMDRSKFLRRLVKLEASRRAVEIVRQVNPEQKVAA